MFIGDKKEPTKYVTDKELSEKIKKVLEKIKEGRNIFKGRILTGDLFVSSKEKREQLVQDFDGFCCEMEGAAIAQVAFLNNIPFAVLRLISDMPDGKGPEDYNAFEKEAARLSSLALELFLEQ